MTAEREVDQMRRVLLLLFVMFAFANHAWCARERVEVKVDFSEADRVLEIRSKCAGGSVADSEWQKLFATEPYKRLKIREASMHRDFTDEDFKKFVCSEDELKKDPSLKRTVAEWKTKNLRSSGARVLRYLPDEAVIHTKVYPMIKPKTNSFVYDLTTDPTIFLYVDPAVSRDAFENTVAHEMHHIGLASVNNQYEKKIGALPGPAKSVADWMGAFGEGEAMLAAAGGPDAPVNQHTTPELKENWARGMRNFNEDLGSVDQFFRDVLSEKLKGDAVTKRAFDFFGLQGPWYTVGYRMAVTVERRYGRKALIECMLDPRLLLERYNAAAAERNQRGDHLALWSTAVLEAVKTK